MRMSPQRNEPRPTPFRSVATARDADIISWHRSRMFQNMGDVSGDAFETYAQTRGHGWKNGSIRRITSAGLQLPQMNRK
jgi:hypothetical protein